MKLIRLLIFIFANYLIFLAIIVKGQDKEDLNFIHLSVRDGLSNNTIQCLSQDNIGKIWIGTPDGLNCYNGYEITTFYKNNSDSLSLPGNYITAIAEDANKQLWIGTQSGLCRYNHISKTFHREPTLTQKKILGFLKTSENDFFVTTPEGIFVYDQEYDSFTKNTFISSLLGEKRLSSQIWELSNGEYLLMAGTQAMIYMPEKREVYEIPCPPLVLNPQELSFSSLIKKSEHEFFLGNYTQGLFQLKKENDSWKITIVFGQYFSNNGVRSLLKDKQGNIWVASYKGLYIISEEQTVQHITPNRLNPNSISYQSITELLQAADGSIWVGTYFGGLNIFRRHNNQFRSFVPGMLFPNLKHNSIRGIESAPDGKIWFGTQGSGIVIMNPQNNKFEQFKHPLLKNANIHSLKYDTFGRMWIGTYLNGLFEYNFKTKKLTHANFGWNTDNVDISSISIDTNHHLYLATMNKGLKILHLSPHGYTEQKTTKNIVSLGEQIRYSCLLKNGDLAISSLLGLQFYSPSNHTMRFITLGNMSKPQNLYIQSIFEDTDKNIWLCTIGDGLIIRRNDGKTINVTTEDGLANNTIYGVIEDKDHFFWVSTNQGISKITRDFKCIKSYDINDGLVSNQFSLSAEYKSADNNIFLGSVNGITVFNPDELTEHNISLTPVIDKIEILNQDILSIGDIKGIIHSDHRFESICLKYEHRSFTMSFLTYYFGGIKKLKYRYRLKNFNDEWRETNLRMADYTNIDPGNYTFEVAVLNPDGKWSVPATVDIRILQVWYLSNMAFLIYFMIVCLLVFLTIKFIRYRINMQNKVRLSKLEIEKTEEVNQMKLRFFTNVSHEFRTPLTLINGPLENLILSEKDKDKKLMLEIANRNSNRLLRLVNNILDFRKAEQGNLKLNLAHNDLSSFTYNQIKVFEELAEKKHILLSINIDNSVEAFPFDMEKMETVMFNLLSNAFKFTKENGRISIDVNKVEKGVQIKITDNGIGISPNQLPKIFERFYQAGEIPSPNSKGSGIGLALVKEIIEAHKGTIAVESVKNRGTTFTVFLPGESTAVSRHDEKAHLPVTEPVALSENAPLPETSGISNGPSVLIIDDNKDLLAFLTHSLKDDYKIILAENGRQGLDRLKKHNPDLIITDVMMPMMDGIEFCQSVKQNIETSHIPLIMLSAKSTMPEQIEGLATGADIYVTKPFSIEYLKLQINNILQLIKQRHKAVNTGKPVEKKKLKLSKRDQEFLDNLNKLIEKNIDNNNLSNDFLAEKLFVSTSTLYRKIIALTGKGINDYIRFKRLVKSTELIKSGEHSISEIAYMTGFNTPSYFSQCFKKEFGVLPKEYSE